MNKSSTNNDLFSLFKKNLMNQVKEEKAKLDRYELFQNDDDPDQTQMEDVDDELQKKKLDIFGLFKKKG